MTKDEIREVSPQELVDMMKQMDDGEMVSVRIVWDDDAPGITIGDPETGEVKADG